MSNDDDLYGDLYGNDEGDFPGFDGTDATDAKDLSTTSTTTTNTSTPVKATKGEPALAPVTSTAKLATATTPATTTSTTTTSTSTPTKKEEPVITSISSSAAPIKTLGAEPPKPVTNPIPTFTDDSGPSFGSMGGGPGMGGGAGAGGKYGAQNGMGSPGGGAYGGEDTQGKMFVGGLNWDTTDDGLRNYFSQFGKIESCTIMRDPAGRSRGFAFLTFEDPAAVNKVMVQEHYLDGKIIDPKRAIPRTEHQRTVKMFVGGLAPSVTNESMREYFSQFGKVIDSTVMVDRDSSRSKGFGFVTFDDQSGAERLLGMPGLQIDGKNIEVKMAQPRAGMAAERNMNNNAGFNRGGGGGGGGGGGSGSGSGSGYGNNYNNNMAGGGGNAGMGGGGGGNMGMGMGGNTPFDPQALATLYQRMAQLAGGGGVGQGGMGWGMNGMAVNPMMGMGGGMGMMNAGMGGGMGGGGMMGGPGGGGGGMMGGGGGMNAHGGGNMRGGNIPRGPAAMRGGGAGSNAGGNMGSPGGGTGIPTGPSGGLGPARMGRGHQHNYHPYSR